MTCAVGFSSAGSSSASRLTPCQWVSSFVHVVTHEMSTTKSCAGSAMNSSHDHLIGRRTSPSMVNSHVRRSTRGVGPADSTGKSVTRCWPGGSRSFCGPGCCRRPVNPRVTKRSPILGWERSRLATCAGTAALGDCALPGLCLPGCPDACFCVRLGRRLRRHPLRQLLLPRRAIPLFVRLVRDLPVDQQLGELAALGLALERHRRYARFRADAFAVPPRLFVPARALALDAARCARARSAGDFGSFVSPFAVRVRFTVAAAIRSAVSSGRPRSFSSSLMCSYWRSRLSLQACLGMRHLLPAAPCRRRARVL